jgi:NADPH:quinone reductase-like Zn-dependent oxidoreductase
MKAIICRKYGLPDKFSIENIPVPVMKDNQVLVKIHASSVTTHNYLMILGKPYFVRFFGVGLFKPKYRVMGSDISGTVESAGKDTNRFKPGDEVFGDLSEYGFGGLAEYASVPEAALTPKPVNINHIEASGVPQAAIVALQGLREKGNIKKGESILIFGASGGIGSYAIQLAKYFGAEVTGVCSTHSLEIVKSLGADHVIDYTKEDYTLSRKKYDLIFAIAYRRLCDHKRALKQYGRYVSCGGPMMKRVFQDMIVGPAISSNTGKKYIGGWSASPNKDLNFIKELIEKGAIKPVVDRVFPFEEAAGAFRYFAKGHSCGKVIISLPRT